MQGAGCVVLGGGVLCRLALLASQAARLVAAGAAALSPARPARQPGRTRPAGESYHTNVNIYPTPG